MAPTFLVLETCVAITQHFLIRLGQDFEAGLLKKNSSLAPARSFLALVAGGKGSHLNCICIRRASVYICTFKVCLLSRCARSHWEFLLPALSFCQRASHFSFCAYFKFKFKSALLFKICQRQNVRTMEKQRGCAFLAKGCLLLLLVLEGDERLTLILHSLIQQQIEFRTIAPTRPSPCLFVILQRRRWEHTLYFRWFK